MNMWQTWVTIASGVVTIAGAIPYLVRLVISPVVERMLAKQTRELTVMVNRRITRHEQEYHRDNPQRH